MNSDPGKLYVLRPGRSGEDPAEVPDIDLMDVAQSLSVNRRRRPGEQSPSPKPSIIVITLDPSRYRAAEFERIDVEWILLESPLEALDHLLRRGENCAAVFTEMVLQGKDNGYRVVDALRTSGYAGPVFVVTTREPLVTERALIKRRGATGSVVMRSESMLHLLQAIAAGVSPVASRAHESSSTSRRHSHPRWLPVVIKQLAYRVGPCAGDAVRKRFSVLHAHYRTQPKCMDLVEEVAEMLSDWPADKARFIAACSTIEGGEA
ncbi:MAG: hypothetical protein JF606_00130 [Burkholderiales bacterium]|jgi:hypothetical protein|nr:hypothetical protein [Burkholderiales bacterium]